VGVDGSPNSLAALRRGAILAAQRGTGLEMIHVIPPETDLSAVGRGYEMLAAATKCAAAAGLHVHDARQLVVCGNPAEALVQRSADAQVLVIGGRFNSAEGNLLGGDVAPYCLTHAARPVDVCADQFVPAAA
jgi:nucleotide-binding universal stress UspA family protein